MYVSMSRLRVPAERAEQLVTAFRARVGLVDDHDGFVGWLAGVLEARDFPLDGAEALAGRLRDAAAHVRGRESFLNN